MEEFRKDAGDKLCRSVSFEQFELHTKLMDESGALVAGRNSKLAFDMSNFLHREVRTDFSVTDQSGKKSWYEEFPTRTDPLSGKSADYWVDIYHYDPQSDRRSEPLAKDSPEYKLAHEQLWSLRDKYTPKVIIELPSCKK